MKARNGWDLPPGYVERERAVVAREARLLANMKCLDCGLEQVVGCLMARHRVVSCVGCGGRWLVTRKSGGDWRDA